MSYLHSIMICNFCSVTDAELLVLEEDLKRTRLNAYAPGTHKNHRSQWKSYLAFCLYFDFTPVPATAHVIALYCQFLSRSLTPQSIRNYLSGVKLMHLIAGFEFPFLQSYEVRLTLKGIQRTIKHTPNRAPPITPDILSKLVSVIDLDDGKEVTFMCAFLLTFFLFARVSNIVPQVASRFDQVQHLCRGDIFECRAGLLVLFKWSKTIQFGERRFMLPLVRLENSPLCPVAMYLRMIRFYPAPPSAPAFTYSSRKDIFVSVHKGEFITFLRAKLALAGVSFPHLYRGHSFRRGAASFAFRSGVPGELIQNFGDWASDAYKTYLEISLPVKVQVAEQMKLHILQHTSVV